MTKNWKPNWLCSCTRLLRTRYILPSLLIFLHFTPHINLAREPEKLFQTEEKRTERYRNLLKEYIQANNASLTDREQERLARIILFEAENLKIPSNITMNGEKTHPVLFLTAFIKVESTFNRFAVSSSGARGYMQLMVETARWIDSKTEGPPTAPPSGTLLFYGNTNIRLGVTYLNFLFQEMKDARLVSLAYNAGPGAVQRGIYNERYWQKISSSYGDLKKLEEERGLQNDPEWVTFASDTDRKPEDAEPSSMNFETEEQGKLLSWHQSPERDMEYYCR